MCVSLYLAAHYPKPRTAPPPLAIYVYRHYTNDWLYRRWHGDLAGKVGASDMLASGRTVGGDADRNTARRPAPHLPQCILTGGSHASD
jgi:hypothetical protein